MFNFKSPFHSFVVWMGNTKLLFKRGMFHTEDQKVADFLRKQKECSEVLTEVPNAKPSVTMTVADKPEKKAKSSK